jgi:hypothetical protein
MHGSEASCQVRLRQHFRKWIAISQYGFPFAIGPYPTPVARFRALARSTRFASRSFVFRGIASIVMTLSWPFGAFRTAWRIRARMIERGQVPNGTRVLLDMLWLALRYSIPPIEYALYQFNDPMRRKDMFEYVYWNDLPGLAAINERKGAKGPDVQDKNRFANICSSYGLPHVETLAVFDCGKQIFPGAAFVPSQTHIWTKALRLKGGAGGKKWTREGEVYRDARGVTLSRGRLVDELIKQDCMVQPFIENHPDIATVTNGALAAVRIVTGLDERSEAHLVGATIGLPFGASETTVRAIVCSIDHGTGRIRHAALNDGTLVRLHPDTGRQIAGVGVPFWNETVTLVRHAHVVAFRRFAFLGWDIALTKEGPLLLETNSGWAALFLQMLDGPLGHTAFSRLIGQYV